MGPAGRKREGETGEKERLQRGGKKRAGIEKRNLSVEEFFTVMNGTLILG